VRQRQELGGTFGSQAGAAQAASAQVGLQTAIQAELVPGLGEAAAASAEESGYGFNLAGMAPAASAAWQKYFDARIASQEKGQAFDEAAWARANPKEALQSIVQRPGKVGPGQKAEAGKWGQALSATGQAEIGAEMIDRIDPSGRVVLKKDPLRPGSETDKLQSMLNAPNAAVRWQGAGKDKRLVVGTASSEQAPSGDLALVNLGLARRESGQGGYTLGFREPGTFGYAQVPSSQELMEKAQEQAFKAPQRLALSERPIGHMRAREDVETAKKQGFRPGEETLDVFKARKEAEKTTVVRR